MNTLKMEAGDYLLSGAQDWKGADTWDYKLMGGFLFYRQNHEYLGVYEWEVDFVIFPSRKDSDN